MSKELEALEKVRNCLYPWASDNQKAFAIIETALKEYEGAKNHIKALNEERIENSLKLKAFEIIKEKKVNVPSLITLSKSQTSYEDYEQLWDNDIRWQLTKNWDIQFSRHKLTQDEYNLLKEILL